MGLRQLRRRLSPHWLRSDARRHWRNVLFRRFGIQRCYTPPLVTQRPDLLVGSWLPYVVAYEILKKREFTFLQIGAFDGESNDDLRELVFKYRLHGVLVEPQPAAFARLRETYLSQPQVVLLQAAIAEREGVRDLYCRRGEASMAASFNAEHLRRHGVARGEIVRQPVVCHTVESALRTAGFGGVDLIQIDAEGFDWPIIRSIDFTKRRPAIIRFEYRHMWASDADACVDLLAGHGYQFLLEPRDIIAHRTVELDITNVVGQRLSA